MAGIIVPLVHQAPKLDQDLAQDVWKQATWQGGFIVMDDPEKTAAAPQTFFSMVHDGKNIYIAVKAEEPRPGKVRAVAVDDPQVGSAIFIQDHFEFFLDVESLDQSCAQLVFNSRGALVDLWLRGVCACGSVEVFHDWDSKTRISTGSGAGFWWAQLCLPLGRLKFSPRSGEWKFNLIRTRVVEGAEGTTEQSISSSAPHPGGAFYNPQFFQRARPENLDFSRFLWDAGPIGSFAVSGKDKELTLRQLLRISNLSPQGRRSEIRCTLKIDDQPEGRTWMITRDFAPGEKREELLEMPIVSEYFGHLEITLTDTVLSEPVFNQIYYLEREEFSWKEHRVLQGDGQDGYVCHPAKFRFLPTFRGNSVVPYGLAEMDNGEIILAGSTNAGLGDSSLQAVVAFSRDYGATWSDYEPVEGCKSQPMMIACLGKGNLTFVSDKRYYSHDYGRTWPERVPVQPAPNKGAFWTEGNPLVDRDAYGTATRIAEVGFNYVEGTWPEKPCSAFIRWSEDGGRTWINASQPKAWFWQAERSGTTYTRSICEGSLIRAANGWLVAALRTDLHPRYFGMPAGDDNLCGTAISISRDEGKTWSPLMMLFEAGRMHGNLVRLPNDDLVLTVIRRIDVRGGRFASYRRGCDALISHDHGLTWNPDRMYVLDDFAYINDKWWAHPASCGHLYSLALDDGSVLTTHGNQRSGSTAVLIHWRP